MNQNRHRISIFLMAVSLVLLAVFLFVFLKKTYADEVAALEKETGYLFVNSIRGIEGEMLDKILLEGFEGMPENPGRISKEIMVDSLADSVKVVTFIGERSTRVIRDSSIRLSVKTLEDGGNPSDLTGSLSIIVAMDDGRIWQDSAGISHTHTSILSRLTENFDAAMHSANLPVRYEIVRMESGALDSIKPIEGASYFDMASGEHFSVALSEYGHFIFKKMWPQVLFSLGLFACVGLAFFTVFKNLQAQRRLTELKNDFIQNVTHELKTPIATVGVAIEALQDFDAMKNPARTQEYLDISKNELSRLSLLVDKVLRMSLFEKKEPELKLETVDFQQLVDEILASMQLQFEKRGAKITSEFSGENFTLRGDRVHLASVIYNLLDNALKYSPQSPVISLQSSVLPNGEQIEFRIRDEGVGISKADQSKIFDKFFRVPTGETHNVKGHGLGLSYVASVVRQHGGTIEVESEKGKSTTFLVKLPKALVT